MIQLMFKYSLRLFLRWKLFSFINIMGLAVGLAAGYYVLLLVEHETGFDRFHPHHERMYRVISTINHSNATSTYGACWAPIGAELNNHIAGITDFCRVGVMPDGHALIEDKHIPVKRIIVADSNFFSFTGFKLDEGITSEFTGPNKIIITGELKGILFPNKNPIGNMLLMNGDYYQVVGIAENPRTDSHLEFSAVITYATLEKMEDVYLEWNGGKSFLTYVKLAPYHSPGMVESLFPEFLYERINKQYESRGWKMSLSLQPVHKIHLQSSFDSDLSRSNRQPGFIPTVSVTGFIILLLAIINYVNLATATRSLRSREIGMRRVLGASTNRIGLQMMLESTALAAFGFLISILLLRLILPLLNNLFDANVSFENDISKGILFAVGLILTTGFLSGIIPAVVFAKIKPELKSSIVTGTKKNRFRNALILLQFILTTVLIISILIIQQQYRFFMQKDLGFDKENVVYLQIPPKMDIQDFEKFYQELSGHPEIASMSYSSQPIGSGITGNGYVLEGHENPQVIRAWYVDGNFLECFQIRMSMGRTFNLNAPADKHHLIVNKKLVEDAGWDDPITKTIRRNGNNYQVIGVCNDFHITSLSYEVSPLIISVNPEADGWKYQILNIRFQSQDINLFMNKITNTWKTKFPDHPMVLNFYEDRLKQNYASLEKTNVILLLFTGIAILVALFGLVGLSVFTSNQRRKEIGIRKVNGASSFEILRLLLAGYTGIIIIAIVLASPVAYFLGMKWLESFAYKIEITLWPFLLTGCAMLFVSQLVTAIQSWRSANLNPVETLRYE